eukprot:3271955-Amphidinium_carterae.2
MHQTAQRTSSTGRRHPRRNHTFYRPKLTAHMERSHASGSIANGDYTVVVVCSHASFLRFVWGTLELWPWYGAHGREGVQQSEAILTAHKSSLFSTKFQTGMEQERVMAPDVRMHKMEHTKGESRM